MSETEALLAEFDLDPETGLRKIMERFELHVVQRTADGFFVLVMAKDVNKSNN